MTQDGKEQIAWHHVQKCLDGRHPDEASFSRLYVIVTVLDYRLGKPRSDWPAWAQYIYFRHRRRMWSRDLTIAHTITHKDEAPNT